MKLLKNLIESSWIDNKIDYEALGIVKDYLLDHGETAKANCINYLIQKKRNPLKLEFYFTEDRLLHYKDYFIDRQLFTPPCDCLCLSYHVAGSCFYSLLKKTMFLWEMSNNEFYKS